MNPEPESGSHIFPKDNPGPDNARWLQLDLDALEHKAEALRAAADASVGYRYLALARENLRKAIVCYEEGR